MKFKSFECLVGKNGWLVKVKSKTLEMKTKGDYAQARA